jgi:hypothetical protein
MGFYFRKRIGLGPFALNFSKSGIGISAGVRGLRAGVSSHRRVYTSAGLPGTGLRFVKYYRHNHATEPPAHAASIRNRLSTSVCDPGRYFDEPARNLRSAQGRRTQAFLKLPSRHDLHLIDPQLQP